MANKVTIDVEARFIDNVSGESKAASKAFKDVEKNAKGAAKAVDELGKKDAKPNLDANTNKFKKAIDSSDKKLSKFGRTKAEAKLGAQDKATSKIDKVLQKVKNFARKTYSAILTAKDYATAGITKALNAAKKFAGRTYSAMVKIRDSEALSSIRKITSGAEKIAGKTWSAVVKVKDLATAPLRGIKNMLFSIKSLVLAITAGLAAKSLIANPINLADQYSSAKIGFSTILGESAGQKMMDDLDEFAKMTPFKTSGVIENAQKMMAMGWDTETLIDDLKVLGDAAAATGKLDVGLESIVRAMSQIKTKGRLSTEELNQLAEAGIAAKQMLAENLGYGTGDEGIAAMTKDLEDGAIASNVAIEALMAGMQKYNGMMDSMANETVEGLWSQIQDTFEINVFRKWGQGLQDGAKRGFGTVTQLLEEAEGALSEFGDMLYEIGSKASNWLADKFQNAVDRILKITDTFEFKNADLGEKISMLWKGVIADPLAEWWEGGGQQKTAETAGKIGTWLGEMLTKGLLALLGVTDIFGPLEDGNKGEQAGMSIAQSFAKGFTDSFDVSAITDKLVDAIGNVWGALPTWAKVLVGGYAGGKAIGGIGNFIGGIANFAGNVGNIIGTTGAIGEGGSVAGAAGLMGLIGKAGYMNAKGAAGGWGILGGLSRLGYGASMKTATLLGSTKGSAALLGITGGTAALAGAGTLAAGASLIKGGMDLYRGYTTDDKTEAKASKASGWTTLGGVGAGAAIGTAILPGVGTLIGAGIGGLVGWFGGDKWADNIRAAKFESEEMQEAVKNSETSAEELAKTFEKAKWESAKKHFGDISLSMEEIARLADQIVFGDSLGDFEKFAEATQAAEASLQALNAAGSETDRWMWKAGLGVKFNEDEIEAIKASFDNYINSAKAYVENKHYEFTASAELILDLESENGKSIVESGNAYYAQIQEQLNGLGEKLSTSVDIALQDGVITLDEQAEITNLQQQIANITNKLAEAETEAELELIKLKFGSGKLDPESFESFMSSIETTLNERMTLADDAFKLQVSTLKLQLKDGAISEDEYQKNLEALVAGYTAKVDSVKADILGVQLNIIGDAYAEELGDDAVADLQRILQESIDRGISPAELSLEEVIELSGNPELSADDAGVIRDYLDGISNQLELVEVDGDLMMRIGSITTEGGTAEEVEQIVDSQIPDSFYETVDLHITPRELIEATAQVMPEDFNIPPALYSTVALKLNAAETVEEKVEILASEFGIPESDAASVLWKISGRKSIRNRISVSASDFGIPKSLDASVVVNLTGIPNYRGGIVEPDDDTEHGGAGGSFARGGLAGKLTGNIPGFSDGGMVRGGSQLVEVAEEGSPEMIIPLSSQRRGRALKLWAQAGNIMGVPGFARGGIAGGRGNADEGIRFHNYGSDDSAGGQTVMIEVGGITVEINVNAESTENIAEAIKAQANEIADAVAGIMADAIGGQFENMPVRGGVA